jgi:hypothetical protein
MVRLVDSTLLDRGRRRGVTPANEIIRLESLTNSMTEKCVKGVVKI